MRADRATAIELLAKTSGWTRWVPQSPTRLTGLGLSGTAAICVASYAVGARPIYLSSPLGSLGAVLGYLLFYLGLAALFLAWLGLGRLVLREHLDYRIIRRAAFCWVTPLLIATPLGSRDLWAYAAQGQLLRNGYDPYRFGPVFGPGRFALEVDPIWQTTPSPYGPLWLTITRASTYLTGVHVAVTVALLRLLAVAGLALLAWTLPALANRAGGRADVATWLAVANPLVLVLGVGGGHNDLLMIGLLSAGLVVATLSGGRRWQQLAVGAALVGLAAAIKSPAIVAAPFLVPLWRAQGRPGARDGKDCPLLLPCLVVGAAAVVTFTAVTELSGLGWGWVSQVNSSAPVVNWMSVPTAAAIGWDLVQGHVRGATAIDPTMRALRSAGTVATLFALALLWWASVRGRRSTWTLLAVSLGLIVVLGPTVEPWYFCWALAIVAVLALRRDVVVVLSGLSLALVAMVRPNGHGLQMNPGVVAILAGALVIAAAMLGDPLRARVADGSR